MRKIILVFLCVSGVLSSAVAGKIRVACIGDSITYGKGIENRDTDSYPAQLQALLGDDYEVRNFGSSGRGVIKSSRRGKGWRAYIKQPVFAESTNWNPQVVICNLGINDIMDYRDGHASEFVPDYLELIHAYQNLPAHPQIFIWTKLAPLFKTQKCYEWDTPFALRPDLERVATETGAVGLDLFSGLVGRAKLFQDDAIHPNAVGYAVIAQLTYKQIKPYLTGDFGGLKIPYVYGDHMVLQRDKELRFQGTANAGQKVTVTFAGKTGSVVAGVDGRWEVQLPAMEAGGPYSLEFQCLDKTLRFKEVMVGEVWIAAGQSNMELPLKQCWGGMKAGAEADDPDLRLLDRQRSVPKGKKMFNQEELNRCTPNQFYNGQWVPASPASASDFSGVAYFFAKELRKQLDVPVGIIHVAIGGAPVEAFISESAMLKNPYLLPEIAGNDYWFNNDHYPDWVRGRAKKQLANWIANPNGAYPGHPFEPSFLYRAAIQPLEQFPVRGVIWYQGESNAARSDDTPYPYEVVRAGLETLITDWRRQFAQGDFPFLYVQLPNYTRNWMTFRQMQLDVSRELPNIGMAVAIDVGDPKTVHPKNKRPVGDRLANLALAKTYGRNVPFSGPDFLRLEICGASLRIFFDFAEGLHATDGEEICGFELAGVDGKFYPAQAMVDGETIVLNAVHVLEPVAARYGWIPDPGYNFANAAKLPASPFRANASFR